MTDMLEELRNGSSIELTKFPGEHFNAYFCNCLSKDIILIFQKLSRIGLMTNVISTSSLK